MLSELDCFEIAYEDTFLFFYFQFFLHFHLLFKIFFTH
jgi:hypothetical protein